jgi:dihydrofolate synthase/folylpolyglutamate synthase
VAGSDPLGGATYFEITTALAFLHFVALKVDAAVVEVGLGGRLDSTNVVCPRLSVITSISFDHMKQLGSTLAEIASEKAGIIKPGVPVVSGVTSAEARRAIEEVRRRQSAPLRELGEDFDYLYRPPHDADAAAVHGEMDFDARGLSRFAKSAEQIGTVPLEGHWSFQKLQLALLGRHQAANAAVALAALHELRRQGWIVPEAAVRQGLQEVRLPARVEVLARQPTVVLDAAHNLASIASLLETLDESFSSRRRLLIFATTQDKQVREMLELLLPRFERVLLTRYTNNPRGVPVEELDRLAREIPGTPCEVFRVPAEAWRRACELATPEHLVCIAGSFFLAAELRPVIAAEAAERAAR